MSLGKIALGALATTAAAWFMHGAFANRCGTAEAAASATVAPIENVTTPAAPATAAAVANCQTDVDAVINGKTINFETSKADIKADSMPLIDALAKSLKDCAGTTVEVAGHTDSRGDDAANMKLSEDRANAVVAALAERGVPNDRLTPKGYGETKPVDPANTQEAYAKNRRIDFTVASAPAAAPATPAAAQ